MEIQLPIYDTFDDALTRETDCRVLPTYAFNGEVLQFYDPVWGECNIGHEPGDEVLLELLHADLVRRSMAIEQLTLEPSTATIPGTAGFARWEHIWGSVAFVRAMTSAMDLPPRDRLLLQLRTFVSDLGHTAYSHLGDWLFQGAGSNEDQHDVELMRLLEVSGINDILRRHQIEPEEVVFPEVEDWIECPSPDLCVDRVDYGAREILRWLNLDMAVHDVVGPKSFTVKDGELMMTSQRAAQIFAKCFSLLPTEHWSEPVHRLQLCLQEELVKDVLQNDYLSLQSINPFDGGSYHPRDLLLTADGDITREMHIFDTLAQVLRPIMQGIGTHKRRIFNLERKAQLASFIRNDTALFPHPLEPYGDFAERIGRLPLLPAHIEMIAVETTDDVPDFDTNPYSFDVFLPALKPRQIDPKFIDAAGTVRRLSEVDTQFRSLLEQQAAIQRQAYVGRVLLNAETNKAIRARVTHNRAAWQEALRQPHMSDEVMRQMLHNTVAASAIYRIINLQWDD